MSRAFVFPGQGSQAVGMGVDLAGAFATARDVFQEIDEALKQNLSKLMREGPESDLVLTENAQPALMAVSIAVIRVLEKDGGKPLASLATHVAGHSLGEYSALTAGAMAALLGIELEPAQEACKEAAQGEIVTVANDNGGGQVVVSGHKAAVERCIETAKPRGAKRGMLLPVSAPFHCPLMQPAADAMQRALETVTLSTPRVPLVANVLAAEITEPNAIKQRLVEQVTGLVRWRESVQYMKSQGVEALVECGSGKVLSGLVKRIDKEMTGLALNAPADIEAFLKTS
jgi:[acyl-carrier-protein] S-malonyltransferase